MSEKCMCHRVKHRSEEEKRRLLNRLSRIEGQIRGIKGMVEKDEYCPDILTQTSAASSAINSFGRELLDSHLRTCVIEDIKAGKDGAVDELIGILGKMMK